MFYIYISNTQNLKMETRISFSEKKLYSEGAPYLCYYCGKTIEGEIFSYTLPVNIKEMRPVNGFYCTCSLLCSQNIANKVPFIKP